MRSVTVPVTLECAGNGRTLYERRPESQPWIREAVGTAEWTGVPVAELLERAGLGDDAVDVVFTGADRGLEGGEEQSYARSLPPAELQREEVLLAYEMNGAPLLPQHGAPLRLVVPGWYGMTAVKWLTVDHRGHRTVRGLSAARGLPHANVGRRSRHARHRDRSSGADGASGHPGVPLA